MFSTFETPTEVQALSRLASNRGLGVFVCGEGSNILVADAGVEAWVLRSADRTCVVDSDDGQLVTVRVGAGTVWTAFVNWAVSNNFAGVECLAGIPGLIGATPVQNVGAYGQETSQVLRSVLVYDSETAQALTLSNDECEFSYRDSLLKRSAGRFVVCSVDFQLRRNGPGCVEYADLKKALDGVPNPSLKQISHVLVRSL
jgi:UDP-N-acetylmuramate dehydrogenase